MSPAVVDFRSPITSPQQTQSRQPPSFQNPNHDSSKPHHFGSFDSINQSEQGHSSSLVDSNTVNSLNIGNVGDGVFNCSFPSPFASPLSSEKLNLSGMSARSRPRFAKLRKKSSSHHGRSTSVSAQKDSFLNPLRSASENLNRVENAPGAPNGFSGSVSDVKFGKLHDVGLAFGAKKSDSVLNSNSGGSESCGSEGQSDAGEFGKFNNVNFVFGTNNSVSSLNSNLEKSKCGQSAEKWGTDNFGKPHNVSFGFTNVSFPFDSNQAKSESKLNTEMGEPHKNVEYSDGREKTEENKSEFRKVDNVDFVFSSNYKDSVSSSNLWKKEYSKNIGKDTTGKMKLDAGGDSGKFGYAGFVFGAGWSDLRSNSDSERIESNENGGKSVFSDCGNIKSTAQWGKFDNLGFVFGSNQSDSASNAGLENKEFRRSAEDFDFIDSGKMNVDIETKLQKEEVHGVFLGGSRSKETSSINGSCKLSDGLNELNSERAESCNGHMKWQTNNKCSVNNKNTFVFGSSSSSLGNAFGVLDEMQALDINDSEKVDGAGTTKGSTTNSCVNVNHMFVFGSNNKKSDSSTGSLGISSCDHFKYANIAHPGNGSVFEKIDGVDIKTNIKKVFAFGDNEKTAGTFGGSVENTMNDEMRNTEPRFGNSSCSLCGAFGKENQPVNLTEKSSDGGQYTGNQPNNDPEWNKASFPSSYSSMGFNFQPFSSVSEAPAIDRVEKDKLSFTSTTVGLGESLTGFSTPDLNLPYSFTANLFPGLSKKLEFSANSRSVREGRLKKRRGKLRQHTPGQQWTGQNHLSKEGSSQQYQECPGCSSPMDFSPCQDAGGAPSANHSTVSTTTKDEDLAAAREGSDINEGDNKCREPNGKDYGDHFECFAPEFPVEEFVARAENGEVSSQTERGSIYSSVGYATAEGGGGFFSNTQREVCHDKTQFCFVSTSETSDNPGERKFSFSASSSAHDNLTVTGRQYGKKYRMKIGRGSNNTTPSRKVDLLNSENKGETISKADEEHAKQESTEAATLEACKTWRIRGNQAYKNGDLSIAEDFYTKGIDSIPRSKIPACCIEPLVLCYSNRAATRLSLGRVRDALWDCRMASTLDPYFLKVHMRAANCHLLLGEVEDALQYFSKCLESGTGVCLDRRITIEAADGLQRAQKVIECTNSSAELLKQRTSDAASNALGIIADALSISCYSEKLLEMRGEALCMLQKYEEVVQLCERTLDFAEKNFTAIGPANPLAKVDGSESKNSFVRLWRWSLMSKSYFHMGKLEVALDLIEKQEQLKSIEVKYQSMTRESSISFAVTVRELLRLKNAGNEAFQFGKHTEALEHYTAAISTSVESRPFAAVCFCNRAAAHQALGQITDAIADCSLSIALDGNYTKALSRRATLHEMIRDYEQAVNDLQKFIAVLEKQSQEKSHQAGTLDRSTGSSVKDLRRARRRLSSMEEKARTEIPLDLYNILGIKASDTAAEIKKAYRKAALRHHPDKAGQFLARCEIGHGGCLWKEIAEKIHMDADRLFKMIGEAYDVLSDPNKRSKYDLKEEMRNDEDDNVSSSFERSYNFYSSPFESRNNRRYWNESWNTYGNSHSHW